MDRAGAQRAVTISAVIVVGVYAYRRLTETASSGSLKNIVGIGNPVPLGQFMTAWGFTFLMCALMAEADPGLGGSFAILIATGDLLTNTAAITSDVGKQEGTSKAPGEGTSNPVGTTQPIQNIPAINFDPLTSLPAWGTIYQPPVLTPPAPVAGGGQGKQNLG
jgi:hypothetical protein